MMIMVGYDSVVHIAHAPRCSCIYTCVRVDPSSILLKNTERVLLLPDLDGKEEVGVCMHHIAYGALTLRCLHPI